MAKTYTMSDNKFAEVMSIIRETVPDVEDDTIRLWMLEDDQAEPNEHQAFLDTSTPAVLAEHYASLHDSMWGTFAERMEDED